MFVIFLVVLLVIGYFLGVPFVLAFLKTPKGVLTTGLIISGLQLFISLGYVITQLIKIYSNYGYYDFGEWFLTVFAVVVIVGIHVFLTIMRSRDLQKPVADVIRCRCGYDLQGSINSHACPECGRRTPWAHHLPEKYQP